MKNSHLLLTLATSVFFAGLHLPPLMAVDDLTTSGSVGFLKKSTDTDTGGNWGTSNNTNWDIAAASITTALDGLATVATDTGTLTDAFNAFTSTTQADFETLRSSVSFIRESTSTLETTLSQRTIVVSDEGGDTGITITAIDIVGDEFASSQSGSTLTLTHTPSAGGGAVENSTKSFVLTYSGSVFLSTIAISGLGSFDGPGHSTWNVIAVSVGSPEGSTVAITGIQPVVSTGGVSGLPLYNRFPRIDIPTATTSGYSATGIRVTTSVVVNAGEWIGLKITTAAISGTATNGVRAIFWYWEKLFGATD